MSGLEIVKIIVDAEKEARDLLAQAETNSLNIRKKVDSEINRERDEKLSAAKSEAKARLDKAETAGKAEAVQIEKESETRIKQLVQNASNKKTTTVKALCDIMLE